MKAIPFDLERTKAGDTILCDNGNATFGGFNPYGRPHQQVLYWDATGFARSADESGKNFGIPSLFMAPKKRVVRVNMYPHPMVVCSYPTKEEADKRADKARIACVRVEFKEGEGL